MVLAFAGHLGQGDKPLLLALILCNNINYQDLESSDFDSFVLSKCIIIIIIIIEGLSLLQSKCKGNTLLVQISSIMIIIRIRIKEEEE